MELISRTVVNGPSRAPHRAMYKAMGLNDDDLSKPIVGVSSTCNEATPCNIHLGDLAQHSKAGVKDSGNDFKKSDESTLLAYYRNSTTLVDGKPAFRAIYLTTTNPSLFEKSLGYSSSTSKAMIVATLVPEKKSIIALIYFADPKDFDDNRPVVEEMFKSFQIGSKGPVIQEED